jgi:hypothetical protein
MKASKFQAKGSEYFPAVSFDPWQVYLTDDNGEVWVAEALFETEKEADALIAAPFDPANYCHQGPSYALGQVDEFSLMDDEEQAHYGY